MEYDNLFFLALQSSLILGFIHGVNPCGHSWLVLAPFVSGEKNGRRISALTLSFIMGTAVACLVIGWSLGTVSAVLSSAVRYWADIVTNSIIVLLGIILLVRPQILHSHEHERSSCCAHAHHEHEHGHEHHIHDHSHHHEHHGPPSRLSRLGKVTVTSLFVIGFVNMIIPCPTVAIMYSYGIESGSAWRSTLVFAMYALTTGIAIGAVIYAIYRIATLMRRLNQHWIENAIMRGIGLLTVFFGAYSLLNDLKL